MLARESERGIVDLETLKKVNADLISTIEETMKIQQQGEKPAETRKPSLREWKSNSGKSCLQPRSSNNLKEHEKREEEPLQPCTGKDSLP